MSVKVNLWSGLTRFTDGHRVIEVKATTAGQVLDGLIAAYPALEPILEAGVSVVIDGNIAANMFTPVSADNEIFLLQQIKGG